MAGFTIIAASVVALRADNLKRRLAYSTVSQLSYVVLAAALLAPLSVIGAALHIAAHAFGKITLFFAAGAIYTAAHKTEVSQLDGIGRRMPWTMGAFAIGALSMIGLPPTAGFVSKWFMLSGAMQTAHWAAVGVIVASTLLNAGYFLPIVYRAFFARRRRPAHDHAHGEAPLPMVLALTIDRGRDGADVLPARSCRSRWRDRRWHGGMSRCDTTHWLDAAQRHACCGGSSSSCWRSPCCWSSSCTCTRTSRSSGCSASAPGSASLPAPRMIAGRQGAGAGAQAARHLL